MQNNRQPTYRVGDKVKVVNYGGWAWFFKKAYSLDFPPKNIIAEDSDVWHVDTQPHLVGKEATIEDYSITQNTPKYSLRFDNDRSVSWFVEEQLELLK